MSTPVVVFCEGAFERVFYQGDAVARAYASGLSQGASYYAGSLRAYVLPEDDAEMTERERPAEVTKARAAIERGAGR